MSDPKAAAGRAAAEVVEPGMLLGLGTGSTVAHFLDALGARGLDVAGVPTSRATEEHCARVGIRTLSLADVEQLDLGVDGADELTDDLQLTKGGGGALTREKVVASICQRMVVVATPDKVVERLGASFALPVEVVAFAVPTVRRRLRELGAEQVVERDGGDYRTDNGHPVLDATFPGGVADPAVLDPLLSSIPGLLDHGLFIDLATSAILGLTNGDVRVMQAPPRTDPLA